MDPVLEHPERPVNTPATSLDAPVPSLDTPVPPLDTPVPPLVVDWSMAEWQLSRWVVEWEAQQASELAAEEAAARLVLIGELGGPGTETVHGELNQLLRTGMKAQATTAKSMAVEVWSATEVVRLARANPSIFVTPAGMDEPDFRELAERTAATDLGLRLNRSPDQVRTMAHEGQVLSTSLPRLWAAFRAGDTGYAHARAAVHHLTGITDPAAISHYDSELAPQATRLTPEAFGRRARTLQQRLLAEPPALRHARAMAARRVIIEPENDGMCSVFAVLSAADGARINARLNATAKRIAKEEAGKAKAAGLSRDQCRTRAQIRADLFAGWLAGDGTPTAAKVRPLLFVPMQGLLGGTTPAGQPAEARQSTPSGPPVAFDQPAILQGYGPIDPVTAAQLFLDAPAFRRVGTDPFTGEVLKFDRTRYRPTKAQREWLAVRYGTCGRKGCERLAVSSDVDHLKEWVRDHGLTNDDNLIPLCPSDHRLKTLTKITYRRDPDGSITVTTPTGYVGRNTPPDPLPRHPLPRAPLPDDPPF